MDLHGSERDGARQIGGKPFQPDHTRETADTSPTAVQSGTSAPGESSDGRDGGDGYDATPPGCNCGDYHFTLSDGRTVHRAPRTVFCPVHGLNTSYRDSVAAHAAWVSRRSSFRRCDLYHVTVTLHEKDVEALGLSVGDTRAVLSQLLPRLRKRLNRRDDEAEALLSLSPRPKSGEYHLHVLVLSKGCTTADVGDVFALDGVDVHVSTPRSREEEAGEAPMSAETFAAGVGAYLFDNRVHGALQGAETRFSSWGEGVGYYSKRARSRRQEYARMMSEAGGDSAPAPDGSSTKKRTQPDAGSTQTGDETADDGPEMPEAAPVDVAAEEVDTEAEYRRAVMSALMARMHTEVQVHGLGRCKLTWAEVGDVGVIVCYVRPLELHSDKQRAVVWRRIAATGTPSVKPPTDTDTPMPNADEANGSAAADEETADEGAAADVPDEGAWGATMAEKYLKSARHRKVNLPTGDGRRRIVEKVDGQTVRDETVPA